MERGRQPRTADEFLRNAEGLRRRARDLGLSDASLKLLELAERYEAEAAAIKGASALGIDED